MTARHKRYESDGQLGGDKRRSGPMGEGGDEVRVVEKKEDGEGKSSCIDPSRISTSGGDKAHADSLFVRSAMRWA